MLITELVGTCKHPQHGAVLWQIQPEADALKRSNVQNSFRFLIVSSVQWLHIVHELENAEFGLTDQVFLRIEGWRTRLNWRWTQRNVSSCLYSSTNPVYSYLESSFKSQGSKFPSWKLGIVQFRGAQITLIRSSPASKRFKRHRNSIMNSGI